MAAPDNRLAFVERENREVPSRCCFLAPCLPALIGTQAWQVLADAAARQLRKKLEQVEREHKDLKRAYFQLSLRQKNEKDGTQTDMFPLPREAETALVDDNVINTHVRNEVLSTARRTAAATAAAAVLLPPPAPVVPILLLYHDMGVLAGGWARVGLGRGTHPEQRERRRRCTLVGVSGRPRGTHGRGLHRQVFAQGCVPRFGLL